jgi:oligoribonuclease NrnB/cAMP/cGMP phosphodiesterase (DHH superfamily)
MINCKKPVYLREDVWQFMLDAFNAIPDDKISGQLSKIGYAVNSSESKESLLKKVIDEPSSFLLFAGLLEHPDLMKNMVIGIIYDKVLDVELEYVVTEKAVNDLKEQKEFIILDRLDGPKQDIAITKQGLTENLARNCTIDYIE